MSFGITKNTFFDKEILFRSKSKNGSTISVEPSADASERYFFRINSPQPRDSRGIYRFSSIDGDGNYIYTADDKACLEDINFFDEYVV